MRSQRKFPGLLSTLLADFTVSLLPNRQARGSARLLAAPCMPKLHAEVKPVAHEAGIGAVAKLKAAFSFFPPLLVLSLIPLSHLCLGKTSPQGWRGLARSRSPSQRVNYSDQSRGRRFPCRQVKRVMDKRAGTKTARHSFPPTVEADAGRRRAPERGAGSGAQAMLSPRCS